LALLRDRAQNHWYPAPREFGTIAFALSGAIIFGAIVSHDLEAALIVAVVLTVAAFFATTPGSFETQLLIAIVLLSATTDLPQLVQAGPVSGLGLLTIFFAVTTIPFWLLNWSALSLVPAWLRCFLIWVTVVCILEWPLSFTGAQNVLVFGLFAGVMAISGQLAQADPVTFPARLDRAFHVAGWVAVLLYGSSVATGGLGSRRIMDPRSFALFALVAFAWALARFRFHRKCGLLAGMLFIMILLSLSRGALGAATVMVALAWFDMRSFTSWMKAVAIAVLAGAVFFLAVGHVAALHSRFYGGDVKNLGPGVSINVSGRGSIWPPVWNDYLKSPWIGRGPGTADSLTQLSSEHEGKAGAGNVHNDYLRVLHDYGAVGLFFWLGTVFGLLFWMYRRTSPADYDRRWQWAAYLGLAGISLEMIVDNPMIEVDVMGPLAILIGIALAFSRSDLFRPPVVADETDAVP
jgi:O-antigen ligase